MNSRKVAAEIGISECTVRYRANILGIDGCRFDKYDVIQISNFKHRKIKSKEIQNITIKDGFYIIESKIN